MNYGSNIKVEVNKQDSCKATIALGQNPGQIMTFLHMLFPVPKAASVQELVHAIIFQLCYKFFQPPSSLGVFGAGVSTFSTLCLTFYPSCQIGDEGVGRKAARRAF